MSETLASIGEFGLIDRIHRIIKQDSVPQAGVRLGIGDDAASFRPRDGFEILVTCDCIVEGRHYLSGHITPHDLGRRAMALNISDIGAMGGLPLYALVSLGLNNDTRVRDIEDLYQGFLAELNPFGAGIIGGNLTKAVGAVFIDITLIGEVEVGKSVKRSTAREGDIVLVTGFPGEAAAGLQLLLKGVPGHDLRSHPLVRRYNRPSHRAQEGRAVGLSGLATAMIDTSDGFLGDLGHICEESGVGAELIQERLPVSDALREAALQLGKDPLELFLGDSDDYELIIICAPEHVSPLCSAVKAVSDVPVTEVGRLVERCRGLNLILPGGMSRSIRAGGWDHFMASNK